MSRPLVVASVGTFHLRFNRLIDWLESWLQTRPNTDIVMQHGASRQLVGADNREMLTPAELLTLFAAADVLVLQGGAGGIMDARAANRIPIVVARTGKLGETVDDHQVTFMARLAPLGHIHLASSEAHLHQMLDGALAGDLPTRLESIPLSDGAANLATAINRGITAVSARTQLQRLLWTMRQLPLGARPLNSQRPGAQDAAASQPARPLLSPEHRDTATKAADIPH